MTDARRADSWRVWDRNRDYGELLFKRAVGDLPEMESGKAAARFLAGKLQPGQTLLDVGCGAGHYLKSLRNALTFPFRYIGVDATAAYVELAREAWKDSPDAEFRVGDIFSLPFPDASFDVVLCCDVLIHLPSIETPLRELVRVARSHTVIRTLVGTRSFRIQEVHSAATHPAYGLPADQAEFDEKGEPRSFNYYNIFSETYVERVISKLSGVRSIEFHHDRDYSPEKIQAAKKDNPSPNATTMIQGWQVNGYVLQPWQFIHVRKSPTA